jgi:hypothetical protein
MKRQVTEAYQGFSRDPLGVRNQLIDSFVPYVVFRSYTGPDIHPDAPLDRKPIPDRILDLTFLGTDIVLIAAMNRWSPDNYVANISLTYPESEKDGEDVAFIKKTLVEKLKMMKK